MPGLDFYWKVMLD